MEQFLPSRPQDVLANIRLVGKAEKVCARDRYEPEPNHFLTIQPEWLADGESLEQAVRWFCSTLKPTATITLV